MIDPERYEYWTCTIGPVQRKKVPNFGDGPLRNVEIVDGKLKLI